MKLATYGWDEKEQRYKIGGKGPVVMMETATPGHYESIGVLASYEVAGHVVKAVNSFEAMREALEGLIAVEDSVTTKQERELRAEWLPRARAALKLAEES